MEQREMTAEQVDTMQKECKPNISTATRQVTGGYIVTGRIVWLNGDGTPRGVQQDEAVAFVYGNVSMYIDRYYRTFRFAD